MDVLNDLGLSHPRSISGQVVEVGCNGVLVCSHVSAEEEEGRGLRGTFEIECLDREDDNPNDHLQQFRKTLSGGITFAFFSS
jgi:hypothetical protein